MAIHMLNNTIILFTNLYEPDRFGRYGVVVEVPDKYQVKPFTTSRRATGAGRDISEVIRCRLRNQDVKEGYKGLRRGDIITIEVSADTYILSGKEHIYPTIINIFRRGKQCQNQKILE
jgi:hypothetical protein